MINKIVSYTEARKNLSYIIKDAFLNENTYVVTQRDIPVAIIQKAKLSKKINRIKQKSKVERKIDMGLFGILRADTRDTLEIESEWKEKAWKGI